MKPTPPPVGWGRPPEELEDVFHAGRRELPAGFAERLSATGALVREDPSSLADASRDWWPLALHWALTGKAPSRPDLVVSPSEPSQVSAVLAACNEVGLPVTAAGGRSGVCGGAIPLHGGVALDLCGLQGVDELDDHSLTVVAGAGTFGPDLESALAPHGLSVGHYPQSMELATIGGWAACRGAGQFSTRYGKIEEIVAGLEVVLANGSVVKTGFLSPAGPRAAMGPDLTQLFVGNEGSLGVISKVALRAHESPQSVRRAAYGFADFSSGLEAVRLVMRRGARPAVLRLYDSDEARRTFSLDRSAALLCYDEGPAHLVEADGVVVAETCSELGGEVLSDELVDHWLVHRNDVSSLASLVEAGIVVETVEVAARWSELGGLYRDALDGLRGVEGHIASSAHESHSYPDGGCLYFTFAGRPRDERDEEKAAWYYEASLRAVVSATLAHRGSLSHHHGIGLARGSYMETALGKGFGVLGSLKDALDPKGILNPGKLGLPSRFGDVSGAGLSL